VSGGCFAGVAVVAVLERDGAERAQRRVKASPVIDLLEEPWQSDGDLVVGFVSIT